MTPRPDRPDEWGTIGDHEERIRILESISAESAIRAYGCTNCFSIPVAYAPCLFFGDDTCNTNTFGPALLPQGPPVPQPIVGADFNVGQYQCNYQAGFRLQINVSLLIDCGFASHIELNCGTRLPPASVTFGHNVVMFDVTSSVPVNMTSGWVTMPGVPVAGGLYDDWYVTLSATNYSILFDGHLGLSGPGSICLRYVHESQLTSLMPGAVAQGDIIYADSSLAWKRLGIGAAGQVLTVNGGGTLPEWV